MEAHLACSVAIGHLRVASAWPSQWIDLQLQHAEPERYGPGGWPRPTLPPTPAWTWSDADDAQPNGWGPGWADPHRALGVRDPDWDGVTLIPKTPGKKRRRRQRKRERAAELVLVREKYCEDLRLQIAATHSKHDQESARARHEFWLRHSQEELDAGHFLLMQEGWGWGSR
ncbi:hypothetical protein C8F04DRAFT_1187136 [Mycena alexandri]|uniref:Uncharacterized protein n=1 Tax=Mycena alexandri TaxID=1745969 RepID=A0AAD6WYH4_9AGAR|nr:hypothetical protein C8F04DRAFT_1187136 [Mycena alexandri]